MAKGPIDFEDTKLETWFERDRAHVDLQDAETEETIYEWRDEAVFEAMDDGFLDSKDLHQSAYDYAQSMDQLLEVEYDDED